MIVPEPTPRKLLRELTQEAIENGSYGESTLDSALRDRLRDELHGIAPDCMEYHAADCLSCTARADVIIRDIVQPELNAAQSALISCGVRMAELRQRAQRAEKLLSDQEGLLPHKAREIW